MEHSEPRRKITKRLFSLIVSQIRSRHKNETSSHGRDRLQEYLRKSGVQSLIHYPIAPHKQSAYDEWNQREFPITEQLHAEVLSLPINPIIQDEKVKQTVKTINIYR